MREEKLREVLSDLYDLFYDSQHKSSNYTKHLMQAIIEIKYAMGQQYDDDNRDPSLGAI
jgi:hypothetical protein